MNKLDLHTPDFTAANIARLAELFPNCATETRLPDGTLKRAIDFDLLRQELSHDLVEGPQERYRLDWPGKREALALANAPIRKTLRPSREESVNFDTTKNLYIEGDNLDALKLLQETYLGQVKMIYIDPPYNTGNDFIYDDDFSMSRDDYAESSGEVDEEGNAMFDEEKWKQNSSSNGRFHSEWLSMIYARLKLARNLLREDGVICIHIDENEYPNLEKILSEIFGEVNNLGTVVWDKRNPKGEVSGVAQQHELVSIFCRSYDVFKASSELKRVKENAEKILAMAAKLSGNQAAATDSARKQFRDWVTKQDFTGGEKAYCLIDENGDVYRPVSMAAPDRPETRSHRPLIHPRTKKPCPVPAKGWRFTESTMDRLLQNGEILFGNDETTQPNRKYLLKDNIYENLPSLLYFGGSDDSLLNSLSIPFPNPKPVAVSKKIIDAASQSESLILDFFSGSATTAHAVMQLNAEDGGNRRHIMVQLPEPCDEKSEAFKAGYATIAEIGKERIRRAGRKILAEWQAKQAKEQSAERDLLHPPSTISHPPSPPPDIGFRVLKIDSSNFNDVYYQPDELTQDDLSLQVDNLKRGRGPEDLLFQVLLDWGVDLALPVTEEQIAGRRVFFVDGDALAACFETGLDESFVKALAARAPLRAVFRDAGYASDAVKINIEQIFKALSPHTELKTL